MRKLNLNFNKGSRNLLLVIVFLICYVFSYAQEVSETPTEPVVKEKNKYTYTPLTLKLSEDGSKYMRFILWGQFQFYSSNLNAEGADVTWDLRVRRARVLSFAQIGPRFLILSHFGSNSVNVDNTTGTGASITGANLFFHDIWGEVMLIDKKLYIGTGLHYWNGLSRLTMSSTLNYLTMDNPNTRTWHSINNSDQFARHFGIYVKGDIGPLFYTFSANRAGAYNKDAAKLSTSNFYYGTTGLYGSTSSKADWLYNGYVTYQFMDKESHKLPFHVGTYHGGKKIFNVGAGFFYHADGTIKLKNGGSLDLTKGTPTVADLDANTETSNVTHFAADVFYESPIGSSSAITLLGAYYNYDYGEKAYGMGLGGYTGSMITLVGGYKLPDLFSSFDLQPYIRYNNISADAFDNSGNDMGFGLNILHQGHNSKVTLEYSSVLAPYTSKDGVADPKAVTQFWVQYHVFL